MRCAARLCVLIEENRMEAANKIAIITDTCCDLPQEYLKEYPIFCVPLVVTSGSESYRDNIDITVETIYARQKNENFKTSLPRPQDIEDVYSAIARQGYTHVIVLMIAECLSSANNLMRLAAEEHPELTVKVFDSKSASIGLGALAVQVARYAVRGVAFDPLCELTKRLIDDTVVYFSLDTLEYLQRGGRIGRATALAGGLLQIKPILTFDRKDGMISTAAKVRGRRGVQQRLIDLGYLSGVADSIFGTASVNALKEFQAKNGLSADGIAGASTYQVLFSYLAISADYIVTPAPTATPLATATPTPAPITKDNVVTIRQGTSGDAVLRLQERLTALGYYNSRRDGVCMADDAAAIRAFQRMNGLSVDGVAGYDTQVLLYSATAIGSDGIMAGASVDVSVTLRRGMTGEAVRALQQRLITLGYLSGTADGIYGTATAEAVYNFQKRNGLTRDGVAGNKTLIALYSASAATPTPAPTIAPVNTPSAASVIASASALHRGDNGTAVKAMQQRLIDLGYLTSGSADGIFGVKTYQALRDFQLANALYVDGVAGKNTIASLNSSSATGKNTARPNTTATPTPNISNDIGTTTKVSAENVVYEYWYSTVRSACRQYPYATVYDYSTGISWQVHMFSYGKHAEAEPLTAADTAKLEQAFGGNTWTPKAVWVIFADGTVRMATTHSMPHEVQHITDNNFPGHLCIHFPRTQAQVTAIGPYAMSHQQTVEKGWAETQAMIAN